MTTRRTADQFRRFIVRPVLQHLDGLVPYSAAAEALLTATALQESGLDHFDQWTGEDDDTLGPAYGVFQIEPQTHHDVWMNFLQHRPELAGRIMELTAPVPRLPEQLVSNLYYATAIARIIYWRAREKMPAADDVDGLARYYKRWFNTPKGKATEAQFAAHFRSLVA